MVSHRSRRWFRVFFIFYGVPFAAFMAVDGFLRLWRYGTLRIHPIRSVSLELAFAAIGAFVFGGAMYLLGRLFGVERRDPPAPWA